MKTVLLMCLIGVLVGLAFLLVSFCLLSIYYRKKK